MGLTKEEKKARKEAKRMEKIRKEIEKKKQMRRDELQREITAQALKRDDIEKSFQELVMKIKEPVFKQDIEVMWHTFERTYDKRDHLIINILKLIDTADDQYQWTVSSFCETTDTMINKFLQDLEIMSNNNDRRTAELLSWGHGIKNRLANEHKASELHLQLLLFHGHAMADMNAWNTRGENVVKEDEERNKFLDIREDLTSFLENTYNNLWEQYKQVLKNYVTGTAENQKQVRRLRRKESMMAEIIAAQAKKIAMSDGIIKRLRSELLGYESGSKLQSFRDRRDRHRAAFHRLKECFLNGIAIDEKQMSRLVRRSDDALELLMKSHAKAEKILRLAALCRRFESRREKVLPYASDILTESSQPKATIRRQTIAEDPLTTIANNASSGLSRLWHKIAKVELTKKALLREKMLLERENLMILDRIEQFRESQFSGATSSTIVPKCNCNDSSNDIRATSIEGSLEFKKYVKHPLAS